MPITSITKSDIIQKGEHGERAEHLQAMLAGLGYNLGDTGKNRDGIDGDFGSRTHEAVIAFQRAHHLEPDGKVGPLTLNALQTEIDKSLGRTPNPAKPDQEKHPVPNHPEPARAKDFRGKIIEHLHQNLGVREATGRNDGDPEQYMAKWQRTSDNPDIRSWCANFAVSMLNRAEADHHPEWRGREVIRVDGNESPLKLAATTEKMGALHREAGYIPQPGDIVLMGGHATVVTSYDPKTGDLDCIGGNVGDAVRHEHYNLNTLRTTTNAHDKLLGVVSADTCRQVHEARCKMEDYKAACARGTNNKPVQTAHTRSASQHGGPGGI